MSQIQTVNEEEKSEFVYQINQKDHWLISIEINQSKLFIVPDVPIDNPCTLKDTKSRLQGQFSKFYFWQQIEDQVVFS